MFEKVAASRAGERTLPPDFDAMYLFEVLYERYAHAFVCLVALPGTGCWITATPELLVAVDPTGAPTVALAGRQP